MKHFAFAAIILVAVAIPAALRGEDRESPRRGAYLEQADEYARAASIPSLSESPVNEIRVWQLNYMTGEVSGTVVLAGKAAVYSSTPPEQRATEFKTKLLFVGSSTSDRAAALLSRLSELASLDGRSIECGVIDGVGIYIDGNLDGRRIAIYAGTPSACHGPEASLVASTVVLAREIAEAAPNKSLERTRER